MRLSRQAHGAPPVFHGGAAIYRLTPCSAEVAFARQPHQDYQLPPTIRAIVEPALLVPPKPIVESIDDEASYENEIERSDA